MANERSRKEGQEIRSMTHLMQQDEEAFGHLGIRNARQGRNVSWICELIAVNIHSNNLEISLTFRDYFSTMYF